MRDKASETPEDVGEPYRRAITDGVAHLLHPSRRVVPFRGRERELSELLGWCQGASSGPLRLVFGPGGVGKSRLAVELRNRLDPSWGFVEVRDEDEDALSVWRRSGRGKLLMLIDSAETRTDLALLLREIAADEAGRTRVLMAARSAGAWWLRLGCASDQVRQMVSEAGQGIELLTSDRTPGRDHDEVMRAVPFFAGTVGVRPPERVDVEFGDQPSRILELHAAALVAVLSSARTGDSPVRLQVADALGELLGHERRYWRRSAAAWQVSGGAHGLSADAIDRLVAVGTLLGARDDAQAVDVVRRVTGRPAAVDAGRLAAWLRDLYPPADGGEWLGRLCPDGLAELHVTQVLAKAPEVLDACVHDVDERRRRRVLVTLGQAAHDLDGAGELLRRLLPAVVGEAGSRPATRESLQALYAVLPYPSDRWEGPRRMLARRLLDSVPGNGDAGERAGWLSALGGHLSALGCLDEALPAEEEAVAAFRELAALHPARYRPELARCLINLGITYSAVDSPAEALPVTEEAIAIYRELAVVHPDCYRHDLAHSLFNLGVTYSAMSRPAEALPAEEEAVAIFRERTASHPGRHLPDLARALFNLGLTHGQMRRPADALAVTQEAVAIFRELAEAHPRRYRPDLARSLANLAVPLAALRRTAEALAVTEEAVAVRRELAAAHPDRYLPDLAHSLANLAVPLAALGRTAEALAVEEEVVGVYRELAADCPHGYHPDLAHSLSTLGVTYSKVGRPADASAVEEEAALIYRDLAAAYPGHYLPDLARLLANLGITYMELSRPADALVVTEEAAAIYQRLAAGKPERFRKPHQEVTERLRTLTSERSDQEPPPE